MLNVEKVLKDLNLRLARFGDSDVVTTRPLLSQQIDGSEAHRLRREIAARLGFKIE
jgi:plasmid stability protein